MFLLSIWINWLNYKNLKKVYFGSVKDLRKAVSGAYFIS